MHNKDRPKRNVTQSNVADLLIQKMDKSRGANILGRERNEPDERETLSCKVFKWGGVMNRLGARTMVLGRVVKVRNVV